MARDERSVRESWYREGRGKGLEAVREGGVEEEREGKVVVEEEGTVAKVGGGREKNCSGGRRVTACAREEEAEWGERGKKEDSEAAAVEGDRWPPLVVRGERPAMCGGCRSGPKGGDREAGDRWRGEWSSAPCEWLCWWCAFSADMAEPASFRSPAEYDAERACGRFIAADILSTAVPPPPPPPPPAPLPPPRSSSVLYSLPLSSAPPSWSDMRCTRRVLAVALGLLRVLVLAVSGCTSLMTAVVSDMRTRLRSRPRSPLSRRSSRRRSGMADVVADRVEGDEVEEEEEDEEGEREEGDSGLVAERRNGEVGEDCGSRGSRAGGDSDASKGEGEVLRRGLEGGGGEGGAWPCARPVADKCW